MKVIYAQPEIIRFEWELEVSITNLLEFGITDIIVLFSSFDPSISKRLEEKYPTISIYRFEDLRSDKSYIPSIRPYLWWKFLESNPEMQNENFLYIDSDVIFREIPEIDAKNENEWLGSDCSGYLSLKYIKSCRKGEEISNKMLEIIGVSLEDVESISSSSIGAQIYIQKPKIEFWKKVYYDCNKIWKYFSGINTDLQTWTAEMWAQLWNMPLFGIKPVVKEDFSFSWATDSIETWEKNKIYHNAGVVDDQNYLFFKGKYDNKTPFDTDFSKISDQFCSYMYVQAIKKVR